MGMLDALMVGAASGAGAGLADAGAQYGKLTAEQILENQQANLEVQKAQRIAEFNQDVDLRLNLTRVLHRILTHPKSIS